jgi:hypothetical protein
MYWAMGARKGAKNVPGGRFTGVFAPPIAVVALGTRPTPFIVLNRLVGVASAGWPPAAPAPNAAPGVACGQQCERRAR